MSDQEQHSKDVHKQKSMLRMLSPKITFVLVSFFLGNLGDGLNVFQGIYLVGLGWNEGSVGLALSIMGLTALLIQPWAGDWVDKTTVDRRIFLTVACIITAMSASAVLFVHEGNTDHALVFITKIIEGTSASFIGPCLAALTLANFGPRHFDAVTASNVFWGHVGHVLAAVIAGAVAFYLYPDIKYCFLVLWPAALIASGFVQYLPQGDQLMGRGFKGKVAIDEFGHIEKLESDESIEDAVPHGKNEPPEPTEYWEVFSDIKTCVLCLTGFFFHFANANVLLVLGEIMSDGDNEDGSPRQSAIPLIAGAIVLAQITMAVATFAGDRLTLMGVGRKPLFMVGLLTLPVRCALIICLKDAGDAWLLSTQILDGLGGGLFGLLHPYLVADITFGTGRFNVAMGLTGSFFGLGGTLSNFLGQLVVEKYGKVASLSASFLISFIPIILFTFMPETLGVRGHRKREQVDEEMTSYKPIM